MIQVMAQGAHSCAWPLPMGDEGAQGLLGPPHVQVSIYPVRLGYLDLLLPMVLSLQEPEHKPVLS